LVYSTKQFIQVNTEVKTTFSGRMKTTTAFAGDMHDLNLFHRVLSAEDVKKMHQVGVCGQVPSELRTGILLSWSDFLGAERFGAVHEVEVDCSRWNTLRSFVGTTITEELIEYLKVFHEEQ